jgi:hypothetical protein
MSDITTRRVTRLDVQPGDRVTVSPFSEGAGTFVGWGDPAWSCPDTHISSPGMRIAYVELDAYGKVPAWEYRVSLDGQPIYVAR